MWFQHRFSSLSTCLPRCREKQNEEANDRFVVFSILDCSLAQRNHVATVDFESKQARRENVSPAIKWATMPSAWHRTDAQ